MSYRISTRSLLPLDVTDAISRSAETRIQLLTETVDLWDGMTTFTDPITGAVLPSKSATEYVPVYGDGSFFCIELNRRQLVELFWRVRHLTISRDGYDITSLGTITSSGYGPDPTPFGSISKLIAPPLFLTIPTSADVVYSFIDGFSEKDLLTAYGGIGRRAPLGVTAYSAGGVSGINPFYEYDELGVPVPITTGVTATASFIINYAEDLIFPDSLVRVGDKYWYDPGAIEWTYMISAGGVSDTLPANSAPPDPGSASVATYTASSGRITGGSLMPDDTKPYTVHLDIFGETLTARRFLPFYELDNSSSDYSDVIPVDTLKEAPVISIVPSKWWQYGGVWNEDTGAPS